MSVKSEEQTLIVLIKVYKNLKTTKIQGIRKSHFYFEKIRIYFYGFEKTLLQ